MHRHAKRRSAIPALYIRAKGTVPDGTLLAFIYMNYRYFLEITANYSGDYWELLQTKIHSLSRMVANKYPKRSIERAMVNNSLTSQVI
jgi:hypothetical protein